MSKLKTLAIVSTLLAGSAFAMSANAGFGHGGGHKGNMNGYGMHNGMSMHGGMGQGMYMNGGMHRGMMGMFGGVNLTAEQQQKIQNIMTQGQTKMASMPMMTMDDMTAMHNLMTADSFDEAKMRSLLEARNKQQVDRRLAMAKIHHDAYQVLTAEQKAQVKANHDARVNLMQQRMNTFMGQNQASAAQ